MEYILGFIGIVAVCFFLFVILFAIFSHPDSN